jgi:hypothetical protein
MPFNQRFANRQIGFGRISKIGAKIVFRRWPSVLKTQERADCRLFKSGILTGDAEQLLL